MANFSAQEIRRQSVRLKEQSQVLLIKLDSAASICEDISITIKSEDSNLSQSWKTLATTFKDVRKKYDNALNTMIDRMTVYAMKTTVNEDVLEKGAKVVGNVLEDVASFLNGIDL